MSEKVVVSTNLKNMLVKLDHFPRDRGENKKCLKPFVTICRSARASLGEHVIVPALQSGLSEGKL